MPARHLPHRGVDHLRIGRIHGHADRAGVVVDVKNFLPALASIGGLENAAVWIGSKQMAQRRDVHHIRILRIHKNPADDVRLAEADKRPALAAIGGLIHTLAGQHSISRSGIACANINNLRIRGRDGHCADIVALEIFVGDVLPAVAVVITLPHAAARRAHVKNIRLVGDARDRGDAPAGIGADAAPVQSVGKFARRGGRRKYRRQSQHKTGQQQKAAYFEHNRAPLSTSEFIFDNQKSIDGCPQHAVSRFCKMGGRSGSVFNVCACGSFDAN